MDNQKQRELTFGEKAVGITFNPSNFPEVESIKRKCADLIDELHSSRELATSGDKSECTPRPLRLFKLDKCGV